MPGTQEADHRAHRVRLGWSCRARRQPQCQTSAGFTGQTVLLDKQREMFRRWTAGPDARQREALLGILRLVHGMSSLKVRGLSRDQA